MRSQKSYARWAGKSLLSARYDWSWKERVRRVEYANIRDGLRENES